MLLEYVVLQCVARVDFLGLECISASVIKIHDVKKFWKV